MDSEKRAIEMIKLASKTSFRYYQKPITVTYSGGKDSDVMLHLFEISGEPFQVHNSHTTVDAPETVYHIRKTFKRLEEKGIKCDIEMPTYKGKRTTMWQLIPEKKMPPTRLARYCCAVLKEQSCKESMIATGVRWDESNQRAERGYFEAIMKRKEDRIQITPEQLREEHYIPEYIQMDIFHTFEETKELILINDNEERRKFIERCQLKAKTVCNPIIDWDERELWNYIRSEKIEVNPLYECGFSRVGCIGCPMAGKHREFEFRRYPKYKDAYIRTFQKLVDILRDAGAITRWKNGMDVFDWYMEINNEDSEKQINIFEAYGVELEGNEPW